MPKPDQTRVRLITEAEIAHRVFKRALPRRAGDDDEDHLLRLHNALRRQLVALLRAKEPRAKKEEEEP